MFSKLSDGASSLNLDVSSVRISVVIRGRPRALIGKLRHGVMVQYQEDLGFTTEIIGVHTVLAGSATIA